MAKLSARGRSELVRFSKEKTINNPEEYIDWERITYALMSDGHLLQKRDVNFKASGITGAYKHTWGWKDKGKAKVSVEKMREVLLAKGYTEEKVRA